MSLIRKLFPPLASGFLFGMGLTVSGMTEPQRVRGFLDVFGDWDPTLAFVMGGAVRSEEHTSELQSLMRISYAVFCLKKKNEYELNKNSATDLYIIQNTQEKSHKNITSAN